MPGIQPSITVDEFVEPEEAVKADPEFQTALRKRGVTESDLGDNALLFARPGSSAARRAGFASKHLWVTPFRPTER